MSTWPSYVTNLLSLRLVGAVEAGNYVRSSYSQWGPIVTWIQTQGRLIAGPLLLTTVSLHYPHRFTFPQ